MKTQEAFRRHLPIGAEVGPDGGVHFRVWADRNPRVEVVLMDDTQLDAAPSCPLRAEGNGYFSGFVAGAKAGMLYAFRLGDRTAPLPDPASRFQPRGPLGPSQVVDPGVYAWQDAAWKGLAREHQVIYEMHVGTFTPEGTFAAAAAELEALADLGITVIELMPVAEFAGRFGWGYDGVDLFAPTHLYGLPDDLRRFIDRAHAAGIGVILDVVYNHLGPSGNALDAFSEHYFTNRYTTEWGQAINFDGPHCAPVREFFLANAGYWIDEFHFDGLRLDATQSIFDSSGDHILAAITRRVRTAARGRGTLLVAENEPQDTALVRSQDEGGYGLDALWNDDFHHAAHVVLTGHREAYYTDYRGTPQEFISAAKYGYLYQGQWYKWQKKRRGTPGLDLPPAAFIAYTQNHDQVANSARGLRCHALTSPGRYRAMTALMLLGPSTPMLFQGQEFAASSPFLYFADHDDALNTMIRDGRAKFLGQFPSIAAPEVQACLADPGDPATFERCKLNLAERETHAEVYDLHRDLLRLRREDPVFRNPRRIKPDGAVLGPEAFVLRFLGEAGDDRLLLVNFGVDLHLDPAPEPLLGPPAGKRWALVWSSEDARYGGCGTPPVESEDNWRLPGHAAVVMRGV